MSKDYKGSNSKSAQGRGGGSSLLVGILIGLLLGLGIALAAAWYINKMPTPFLNRAGPPARDDAAKGAARSDDRSGKSQEAKSRFDFYKILPGAEEQVTEPLFGGTQQKPPTAAAKEAFFLQAGAFQNAPDADNMKARLALLGVEASVQTSTVADKGVWHRVRAGPYLAIEELNRTREILRQNGIETTLIRVREEPPAPAK